MRGTKHGGDISQMFVWLAKGNYSLWISGHPGEIAGQCSPYEHALQVLRAIELVFRSIRAISRQGNREPYQRQCDYTSAVIPVCNVARPLSIDQ